MEWKLVPSFPWKTNFVTIYVNYKQHTPAHLLFISVVCPNNWGCIFVCAYDCVSCKIFPWKASQNLTCILIIGVCLCGNFVAKRLISIIILLHTSSNHVLCLLQLRNKSSIHLFFFAEQLPSFNNPSGLNFVERQPSAMFSEEGRGNEATGALTASPQSEMASFFSQLPSGGGLIESNNVCKHFSPLWSFSVPLTKFNALAHVCTIRVYEYHHTKHLKPFLFVNPHVYTGIFQKVTDELCKVCWTLSQEEQNRFKPFVVMINKQSSLKKNVKAM